MSEIERMTTEVVPEGIVFSIDRASYRRTVRHYVSSGDILTIVASLSSEEYRTYREAYRAICDGVPDVRYPNEMHWHCVTRYLAQVGIAARKHGSGAKLLTTADDAARRVRVIWEPAGPPVGQDSGG
jgi:hypothetical protein